MSIGRSKEEQELTAMLSATLVQKEVMEPMNKIGWSHSAPPPPDYSGQPAPAEGAPGSAAAPAPAPASGQPAKPAANAPAPASAPKADGLSPEQIVAVYESMRDPETGLIGRKYKTVEEAMRGSGHLVNMSKQAFSERDAALAELAKLRAENLTLRQTPVAPAPVVAAPQVTAPVSAPSRAKLDEAQARLDAVLSNISENGGILDGDAAKALSKANREVADAAAEVRVAEDRALREQRERQVEADNAAWREADEYMAKNHPASARFADEVALLIQSDPLLAAAVNALRKEGNRIGAVELAWKTFERIHGSTMTAEERAKAEEKESELAAREQVRNEHVAQARKDAGVVTGSPGGAGVHENRNAAGASREEIEAARSQMRIEGDAPGSPGAMRFREMVIGPSLDPAFFPRTPR